MQLRQVRESDESASQKVAAGNDVSTETTQKTINGLGRVLSLLNDAATNGVESEAGNHNLELSLLTLIENDLKPAVLCILWFDSAVHDAVTHPYYASCAGFPAGMVFTSKLKERVRQRIMSATKWRQTQFTQCAATSSKNFTSGDLPDAVVSAVMQKARDCVASINDRLAKRLSLLEQERESNSKEFSQTLSKADALLFACCAVLRRVSGRCGVAQTSATGAFLAAFRSASNLASFVDRVQSSHFSELRGFEESSDAKKSAETHGVSYRKITLVFVGGCVALACYALASGLVQVQLEEEDEEHESEE